MDPEHRSTDLDLHQFAQALRRRAWLVIGFAVGLAVVVYVWSSLKPDLYRAASEVQVVDNSGRLFGNPGVADNPGSEIATAIYAIEDGSVSLETNRNLAERAEQIDDVSATSVEGTNILRIVVTSRSPEVAMDAANTFAEVFVQQRRNQISRSLDLPAAELTAGAEALQEKVAEIDALLPISSETEADVLRTQRAGLVQQQIDFNRRATEFGVEADLRSDDIVVLKEAFIPKQPFAPQPLRDAVLGGLVGLVLGVGTVFLFEWLDRRVTSPDKIEALTGVPVLGAIPVHSGGRSKRWSHNHRSPPETVPADSAAGEAYRTLQTSLRFSNLGKAKRRIAITSASGGEGKTTLTANLAKAMAEAGLRVVVVSADLRRPFIGKVLGVDDFQDGLSSVLLGDAQLADCLVPVQLESDRGLAFLPSGPTPGNPAALLASPEFGLLLDRIEDAEVDFILLDCAPVLPVSDPLALIEHVDGVLVVAVADRTRTANLVQTVDRLRQVGADLIGVVVNGVAGRSGYQYGYRYQGHYAPYSPGRQADKALREPSSGAWRSWFHRSPQPQSEQEPQREQEPATAGQQPVSETSDKA